MRQCASVADQFAQTLSQVSYSGSSLPEAVQARNGNKRQGTEDDDIEGPTKKRRVSNKKIKDPDAPKRAASSYIFFQNDLRQELRKQHPDITAAEVMARVSKQWAGMTREQKAPYERLQAEAKLKWETEKRAYEERRGIVATTKPAGHKVVVAPVEALARNGSPGIKLARKPSEPNDSSTDTGLSDKSEEEDGAGGNSDEEEEEEEEEDKESPSPPPPPKTKTRSKAEVSTASAAKSKSKVSSPTAPMPARQEKKKRSNKA